MTTIHAYTRTRVGIFANPKAGLSPRAIKGLLDSVNCTSIASSMLGFAWRITAFRTLTRAPIATSARRPSTAFLTA
ncbi:MAG: hypothetical protein WB713_16295 [Methyloceanibacter sp.]